MKEKRIILIGLGPHARRIYYPLLEKQAAKSSLQIALVVDVENQRSVVENYLSDRSLQPQKTFFVQDEVRREQGLDNELCQALQEAIAQGCDGLIIASEAYTHEKYITWALDHDIDILTDKPLLAPAGVSTNIEAAEEIFAGILRIERKLAHSKSNLIVQCQRRRHVGYQFIYNYLHDFLQQYPIPISYLNIYHADGMWGMPPELFERDNHPYKYGYGKLMHSGYHFVDLFAWLAALNNTIAHKSADSVEMFVQSFRPSDFLHQINETDYQQLFNNTGNLQPFFSADHIQRAKGLGELDTFVQCQLKHKDFVVTTGSIELQQNSFSRRAWVNEACDVYKGNGRVRHERVNIQVGTLLNIQVHSYQSYEVRKMDVMVPPGEAGHEAHFDIHIYRNSDIIGGKPYQKLTIGQNEWAHHRCDQTYLGHNEKARETIFQAFLNGCKNTSNFSSHKLTNLFLTHIYRCMAQTYSGQQPYTNFAIEQ